jgi:CBS domain containing-hemolysin-like protein
MVLSVLMVSFVCSLLESVLLSTTHAYINMLQSRNVRAGAILHKFKENINRPITAILILNTIANTAGAAVAGGMARRLFGSDGVAIFSALFTMLILVCSEVIPKTIGAQYWKSLASVAAYAVRVMIVLMLPLVIPINWLTRVLSGRSSAATVSKDEVVGYVRLAFEHGKIDENEMEMVENIFSLRSIAVRAIMTPRTVAFWLDPQMVVGELKSRIDAMAFSRIPLYEPVQNRITGVVLRRAILAALNKGEEDIALEQLANPPTFVPESMSVYHLLNTLVERHIHIAFVINEYGDYIGIVTLEDALETLLGREIVDESDKVPDMQELARQKMRRFNRERERHG